MKWLVVLGLLFVVNACGASSDLHCYDCDNCPQINELTVTKVCDDGADDDTPTGATTATTTSTTTQSSTITPTTITTTSPTTAPTTTASTITTRPTKSGTFTPAPSTEHPSGPPIEQPTVEPPPVEGPALPITPPPPPVERAFEPLQNSDTAANPYNPDKTYHCYWMTVRDNNQSSLRVERGCVAVRTYEDACDKLAAAEQGTVRSCNVCSTDNCNSGGCRRMKAEVVVLLTLAMLLFYAY